MLTINEIKAFNKRALEILRALPTPPGFAREEKHSPAERFEAARYEVTFTSDDVKIRVCHYPQDETKKSYVFSMADGHVDFKTAHGWLTFDRHGFEDSFYLDAKCTLESATEELNKQVQRAKDGIARHTDTTQLPGVRFTCLKTKSEIEEIKRKLKAGQRVTLSPGGMGQGVILFTATPRGRFAKFTTKKAPVELQSLLGCSTLWMETYDHD